MSTIVVATGNVAKFKEIKSILDGYGIDARMPDLRIDVEEGTASYEDNAILKASYLASRLGTDALGEDSGIEVPALGGFPGVVSARFVPGPDSARNAALLDRMKALAPGRRKAVFKAYAAIALKAGGCITGYGELEGTIADGPAGADGFGYDPVFVPEGYDVTLAQMTHEDKNRVSHRRKALEDVVRKYIEYKSPLPPFAKGGDGSFPPLKKGE